MELLENTQSHDWNKERLEQLKNIMPDLFTNDGQLNINELKKVVNPSLVSETERYEFRWFGKSNAKREAFTPTDATLVYDEHRSVNPTESDNLIIEGENLAVLKLLSNSYREQVKCIYIDPPYNTGKDFVYSDKFNQDKAAYWEDAEVTENGFKIDTNTETDGRFHSNWLNMMYSRLLIARQLLKEDGVIFISIDDNEVHHLRKLCDEVFGEENFITAFMWKRKKEISSDSKNVSIQGEYIMSYAKSESTIFKLEPLSEKYIKDSYKDPNKEFPEGKWRPVPITVSKGLSGGGYEYDISNPNGKKHFRLWAYPEISYKKLVEDKLVYFGQDGNGVPQRVIYAQDSEGQPTTNYWDDIATNKEGKKEILNLFEENYFDTPKPSSLIKKILNLIIEEDDFILDFFAGSGTTGQAITELNQEDGGNRKYILVQLPEATDEKSEAYKAGYKKISDITIERNKRVVAKIQKELKEKEEKKKGELPLEMVAEDTIAYSKNSGLGFKVFKLQKSNFPRVEYAPDPEKSHAENVEALKKYIKDKEAQLINAFNKEELITEILLKNGFKLNYTLTKQEQFTKNEILFATDGDKETLVCLDGDLAEETVEYFKKNMQQKLIVLERALDTTKKWNLKHYMKDNFKAF
ncbi:site-specific DNA-methyltransferase [Mariniflexile sp.]|uniref:site-specific DNA-methyltransferase n=1 Tax=Mariniflexile sp. TaxID=1979402 RepID=UPI004047097E